MTRRRLDSLLVERGLIESRERARALIMAGEVRVGDFRPTKPGTLIPEDTAIELIRPLPYVSRGGIKLAYALDAWAIDVTNKVVVDIGASTGGFTDCLLQRGARLVYAVDVGYGQLDYRLRRDPRVVVMERVNARYPLPVPEPVDMATMDVSFISLTKVLPPAVDKLTPKGLIVALVKPQFEAGRSQVGRGGLVKDPNVHAAVLGKLIAWAVGQGLRLKGLVASPILGASGNREFLVLWMKRDLREPKGL